MILIPGQLIATLTFPGVIVHEAAHVLFCRVFGLAVFEVCYFQFDNPAGYVVHEEPRSFAPSFFVSMGPFLVNSALCLLFSLPAVVPIWQLEVGDPLAYGFAWLGISIGMHAFPSTHDLESVWRMAPKAARSGQLLAIAGYPLIVLLYLANFGRIVWIDLFYGMAVGVGGPLALLHLFA